MTLARRAGEVGGTLPAVFNAANEVAVEAFVNREISFDRNLGPRRADHGRHQVVRIRPWSRSWRRTPGRGTTAAVTNPRKPADNPGKTLALALILL